MPLEEIEISRKIKRQITRYLGELSVLNKVIHLSDTLDESLKEEKKVLANICEFLKAIDKSYEEYEDRINMSVRNLQISSDELNEVNQDLERLNLNINAMLDSLREGLLFFDEQGICAPYYSKTCSKIFDVDPTGKHVAELIGLDDKDKADFDLWLSIVYSQNSALNFNDLTDIAPSEFINKNGRHIELVYRPMYITKNTLNGILLIATDITERLKAQEKIRDIQKSAHFITSVAKHRNDFTRYIKEIKIMIDFLRNAPPEEINYVVAMRDLHTFKGLAMTFGLDALADSLHEAEDELKANRDTKIISEKRWESMLKEVDFVTEQCRIVFGEAFLEMGQVRNIEYQKLKDFRDIIREKISDEKLQEELVDKLNDEFIGLPVRVCFKAFVAELYRLAKAQGKAKPNISYEGGDMTIVTEPYQEFMDFLFHLSRNIIDHAIETPEERVRKGKDEAGQIFISVTKTTEDDQMYYQFKISDDGRGINPSNIRAQVAAKGLNVEGVSDEDIIYHIFDPEFTTREKTSTVSGRGIGLNAVKQCVDDLGGKIELKSELDKGTTFIFKVPYID